MMTVWVPPCPPQAATAVAGEVSELGRVPSGPWLGQTGTAGPENRISTFMSELLAQRACGIWKAYGFSFALARSD